MADAKRPFIHGFDSCAFHELSELRSACFLLRGDPALSHIRNLHAVFILSQLGGLHKIRDSLDCGTGFTYPPYSASKPADYFAFIASASVLSSFKTPMDTVA